MAFSVCKDTTFSTTPPDFLAKKVILVNGNFSKFVLHLAAGSDKGIKKGAGEVAVYHFGIFGYLQ